MAEDFRNKLSRIDDFWDIGKMIPEKKADCRQSRLYDTEATELMAVKMSCTAEKEEQIPKITDEQRSKIAIARKALSTAEIKTGILSAAATDDKRNIYEEFEKGNVAAFSEKQAACPICEYCPENNKLIKKVTVKAWQARYTVYERFREMAIKYRSKPFKQSENVPFFSYVPQYSQLNENQLEFYLYWRDQVENRNIYPEIDYSYILLYLYEIINLPDIIPAKIGAERICRIWRAYRKKYRRLDSIIPEWLCDYCLIGQIDPPTELFSDFYEASNTNIFLREYYSGYDKGLMSPYAAVLFSAVPSYSYKHSKYINNENRDVFEKHIKNAFIYAFSKVEKEKKEVFIPLGKDAMTELKISRDAFAGAVCSYHNKRRIEIEYLSCIKSAELKFAATDMMKYAENGVRALLGIKSRFHTPNLAIPLKRAADEYFTPFKTQIKKEKSKIEIPEYEKLYEDKETSFSFETARQLEKASWEVTNLLVGEENFGKEELSGNEPVQEEIKKGNKTDDKDYIKSAVTAVLRGDMTLFSELAGKRNLLADSLCESVNEALFEIFGDTVILGDGNKFSVVPDYAEDLVEWIKK